MERGWYPGELQFTISLVWKASSEKMAFPKFHSYTRTFPNYRHPQQMMLLIIQYRVLIGVDKYLSVAREQTADHSSDVCLALIELAVNQMTSLTNEFGNETT